MVETRFDRGVYEDEEESENSSSSGGGGGGGSSSDSSSSSNNDLNLTENEKDADVVIRDGDIVAADEDANVDSSTPTQTIDSGGGGGSSSSSNKSSKRQETEMERLERIAKEGFSEQDKIEQGQVEGPEKVAEQSSITVEEKRKETNQSNKNRISKDTIAPNQQPGGPGDPIDLSQASSERLQKAQQSLPQASPQAQRNREELKRQQEAAQFKEKSRQTLTEIEQAENDVTVRFGDQEVTGEQGAELINQQIQETKEFQEQSLERFKETESRKNKSSVEIARENADTLAEESLVTGVDLMQRGQDFADETVDDVIDVKRDLESDFIEANPFTAETVSDPVAGIEGTSPDEVTADFGRGAATSGSQLGGLIVATPGATVRALDQDTPSLSEGAVKGGELTVEEFTGDPSGFIAEEAGEEISEKALASVAGKAAGSTLGGLSVIPTPDFGSVRPETSSQVSAVDRGVAAALPGSQVMVVDTEPQSTPDFVNEPGPESQPEPDTSVTDIDVTGELETETSTTEAVDSSLSTDFAITPVVDAISRPSSVSQPQSISQSRPETNILSEPRTQSNPLIESSARAEARAESRAELDLRVEPKVEPSPRPETRPSPTIDLGRERRDPASIIDGRETSELETSDRFAPSLDALITGETADEDEFDFDQEFTGLETRPLPEAEDIDDII